MKDLEAVRRLAAEPTDESVARTWYRITNLEAQRPQAKRLRLAPALAGLAVVALIAASLVIYRTGEGTLFPIASKPEAVELLNSMADLASTETASTVAKGQSVRTEIRGIAGVCGPAECRLEEQNRIDTYDPFAGTAERVNAFLNPGIRIGEVPPPGIARPTLDWLASLPSDPHKLLRELREAVGHNDSWTVDHQLWDAMGQLYMYCEKALTPAQRATLLRALAGTTGLSVRHLVIDGVALVAIRQSDKSSGAEIIFDPATGHAVGRASVFLDDSVTIRQMPGGPRLEKGVTYQATWKQTFI
jgi:hypothetical protein